MGRILAIDYGKKRVGIAVTDENQIIANSLTTIKTPEVINFLYNYISKEKIDCIVVGEPKNMKNEESESAKFINPFVKQLAKKFPNICIERYDERFTSKIALQTMIESGFKKKTRQKKEIVDTISATIILQSYMNYKNIKQKKE